MLARSAIVLALAGSVAAFAPAPALLELRSAPRAATRACSNLKMGGGHHETVRLTREGFTSYIATLSIPWVGLLVKMKTSAGEPKAAPAKAAPAAPAAPAKK